MASYFVALRFREPVSQFVHASPPWNVFVAMLVLYVGMLLAIWIVFRMVSQFIDRMKLKEFDRQIGALFGFAKGLLLCVLVTLFAVTLLGETQRQAIVRSRSGNYIAQLLDKSSAVMPREVHEVLDPYINRLDEQLQPAVLGSPFDKPPTLPDVEKTWQTWLESNPASSFTPSERTCCQAEDEGVSVNIDVITFPRRLRAPEGQLIVAQQFTAGDGVPMSPAVP